MASFTEEEIMFKIVQNRKLIYPINFIAQNANVVFTQTAVYGKTETKFAYTFIHKWEKEKKQ